MSGARSEPGGELGGRGYLKLIVLGGAIGLPAALVAALFLALVHDAEDWLWNDLPDALGDERRRGTSSLGLPVAGAADRRGVARGSCPATAGTRRSAASARRRRPSATGPGSRSPRSARSRSGPCSGPRRR